MTVLEELLARGAVRPGSRVSYHGVSGKISVANVPVFLKDGKDGVWATTPHAFVGMVRDAPGYTRERASATPSKTEVYTTICFQKKMNIISWLSTTVFHLDDFFSFESIPPSSSSLPQTRV
jgi:hypothetical protein